VKLSENRELGSFRDPSGHVFYENGRVFRTVNPCASEDFSYVEGTGLPKRLVAKGWLIDSQKVDSETLREDVGKAQFVLEHPRIPFISYPYEWSFSALKSATLLHLDLHLEALQVGVTLSDASAYNIQFIGTRPVFIDRLSLVQYRDGEIWVGHGQFCEQFLNPLLLRKIFGVPHNYWYRGSQEGITSEEFSRLLPFRQKWSRNIFTHIVLPSFFQKTTHIQDSTFPEATIQKGGLPRARFIHMLTKLRNWIEGFEPADGGKTKWAEYEKTHSYKDSEAKEKADFIREFTASVKPKILWDIGCNTGVFSEIALESGAKYVVGFDFDHGALETAFCRSKDKTLQFLPVFLDAANPTSNQGWGEIERKGLSTRANANGILALALIHHLAIAKNISLGQIVEWLVSLAPEGVVEFVPKQDEMVKKMLKLRIDIFQDYSQDSFLTCLRQYAEIKKILQISTSGRSLIWFSCQKDRTSYMQF